MNYPPKTLLEQQCMTFYAVMKAMEGHLTEHNILATCDKVWRWTRETLNADRDVASLLARLPHAGRLCPGAAQRRTGGGFCIPIFPQFH